MADDPIFLKDGTLHEHALPHYQVRDHLHAIVASFQTHYDGIIAELESSQVARYERWWLKLKAHLLREADIQDQLGRHLEKVASTVVTTDTTLSHRFPSQHPQ